MHPSAPLSVAFKPTGHGRDAVLQYQARGIWHSHWLLIEQHNVNGILFYPFGPLKSQLLPVLLSQAPPQNWSCIDQMHVVLTQEHEQDYVTVSRMRPVAPEKSRRSRSCLFQS